MSRNELEELRRLEELERRAAQERGQRRYEDSPGWQKAVAGLGRPWYELAAGVKTLTGGELSPEEQERLAMFQSAGNDLLSIPGLARIAGEIPQYAGASGGARAAGRALPRAMSRRAATRAPGAIGPAGVAREAAAAASVGAVRQPAQGQTRAGNAALDAAGAVGGEVVGKALRGITPTPDARALMDQGIPLTPGQISSGRVLPTAERLVGGLPLARRMLERQRQETLDAFNRNILRQAQPPGAGALRAGTPQESIQQIGQAFSRAYEDLFSGTLALRRSPASAWQAIHDVVVDGQSALPGRVAAKFSRNLAEVQQLLKMQDGKVSGRAFQQADDLLREYASKAAKKGSGIEAKAYDAARRALLDTLPEDRAARLRELDAAYARFKTVERAAGYTGPARQEGRFTPQQLGRAAARNKYLAARGQAAFQPEAAQVQRVFDQVGSADAFERLGTLGAVGAAAYADPVLAAGAGSFAAGLLTRPGQALLAPRERAALLADTLRRMGASPGAIGASIARPAQEQDRRPVLSRRTVGPVKAEDLVP